MTWRRDSLAGRPIEILAGDKDQPTPAAARRPDRTPRPGNAVRGLGNGPGTARQAAAPRPPAPDYGGDAARGGGDGPRARCRRSPPRTTDSPSAPAGEPTPTAGRLKRRRKGAAEPQQKKLSALDAAARVLAETGAPMGCASKELDQARWRARATGCRRAARPLRHALCCHRSRDREQGRLGPLHPGRARWVRPAQGVNRPRQPPTRLPAGSLKLSQTLSRPQPKDDTL